MPVLPQHDVLRQFHIICYESRVGSPVSVCFDGADVVLVMQNGNVVEQGNHEERMKRGGEYAKLYHRSSPVGSERRAWPGGGLAGIYRLRYRFTIYANRIDKTRDKEENKYGGLAAWRMGCARRTAAERSKRNWRGVGSMNVSSMIGMGAGFAAVGGIYALLSFRKPDLPIFKKYTKEQFYRNQGMMLAFCSFGIMLILLGLMTM